MIINETLLREEAEAKAVMIKVEAEAKEIIIKAEADAEKMKADANKTNADTETVRACQVTMFAKQKRAEKNAKNAVSEEYREMLNLADKVDKLTKCGDKSEQAFWKERQKIVRNAVTSTEQEVDSIENENASQISTKRFQRTSGGGGG